MNQQTDQSITAANPPLVSIVIVNFDEEQFLVPLLESLRKHEASLHYQVIILDNHSQTDISLLLKDAYPEASVFKQEDNQGFGKTNNKGIRMADGSYLLILNPDTLFHEASISKCIDYFSHHRNEKIAMVGCRLVGEDGEAQKSFFQLASSIRKTIQANAIYTKLFRHRIKQKSEEEDLQMHSAISNPPWLCGAFLFIEREQALKERFFFDEDFFLYSEDCELGHRISKKGFRLAYLPSTSVLHYGGGSLPSLRRFGQLTISEWLCMMKVHGKFYFLCNQTLVLFNILFDQLLFINKKWFSHPAFHDRRQLIIRRRLWQLWKRYTFMILINYNRKESSSRVMLRFS